MSKVDRRSDTCDRTSVNHPSGAAPWLRATAVVLACGLLFGCGSSDELAGMGEEVGGSAGSNAGGSPATSGASPGGGGSLAGVGAGGTPSTAGGGAGGSGGDGGAGGTSGTSQGGGGAGGGAPPKFVGNITTGNSIDPSGRTFSTYWNQITPENAGKWGSVQRSAGAVLDWSRLDPIYDYAQKNNIIFKQHVFVWGKQQPSGNLTEADVKKWMSEFCKRYPNTPLIDVVNEPPPHTKPSYDEAIGGGTDGDWTWIVNAFKWAREACPNSILILNDYNNIEYADQNQHFIDIAKKVLAAGAPIDALGAQAHGLAGNVSTDTMKSLISKMHTDTGLPVYITEYDIGTTDDAQQLAKYQEHMSFFLDTPWIPGITLWGWIHGQTWVQNTGLIKDGQARPAMTWLMQELGRPAP